MTAFAIPVSVGLLKGLPSSVYFCTAPAGLVTVRLLASCATVIIGSAGAAPPRPPPPPPRPPPPPAPPEFGSRVSQYCAFGVGSLFALSRTHEPLKFWAATASRGNPSNVIPIIVTIGFFIR